MLNKNIFEKNPFSFSKEYRKKDYFDLIKKLTIHHYKKCSLYKKILNTLNYKFNFKNSLENIPMIPTRIFKNYDLMSVPKNKIIKTLTSSGTTNSRVSKIYLDNENASNQVKALKKLIQSILGEERLPMIIVDQDPKFENRKKYSAKTAAILGFSYFGKNHFYLLDKYGNIDYNGLNEYLKKFSNKSFFIFGFTSFIFENLLKKIDHKRINLNLSKGILLHGGGWKKLENLNISNKKFKDKLNKKFKLKKIFNYYGMVEQTGSIFLECSNCGGFRTTRYSEIIIRDKNFNSLGIGKTGMTQVISNLPTSYPGHSILTEDRGTIIKDANCKSDFNGKCFIVKGRLEKAEIRGCSDVT